MDVKVGLWRKLSTEKLMLLNCGVGEDSWESLGLQGDPTSPSWRRSVLGVHWKDWCWSWNSSTLATFCKELTHWKDPHAGRDWRQEEKVTTEDEMAGWHHRLDGHEFEWTPGVGDGQGGLECCIHGVTKSRTQLNDWTEQSESHSVVSDSLRPHGLYSPWNSPGQNAGVSSLFLLQGIFPAQGSNPGLLHCRQILYQLSHKRSPRIIEWVSCPFSRGSSRSRNQPGVSCITGRIFTKCAIREALILVKYMLIGRKIITEYSLSMTKSM